MNLRKLVSGYASDTVLLEEELESREAGRLAISNWELRLDVVLILRYNNHTQNYFLIFDVDNGSRDVYLLEKE